MRETILGNHIRKVPSVAVGCMRLSEKSKDEMNHFIHAALEQGAYFFDHADIYGGGMSESIFGEAFADDPSLKREDMYLQSKCGIRQGFYDFSKEHILKSVDGILNLPPLILIPCHIGECNCISPAGRCSRRCLCRCPRRCLAGLVCSCTAASP